VQLEKDYSKLNTTLERTHAEAPSAFLPTVSTTPERGNDFSHAKTTLARIQADCQSPSRDNFTNIRDVETPNDRATMGEHRHLKEVLGELSYLDEELKNAELCRFKTSRR
jgi:hypothetical protein